jgi:hypothetical protein
MALENILGAKLHRRWMIAFAFGLVHGFGFSFALRDTLQFAGAQVVTSLLSFNVGVELGQLFALALIVPALGLLFRYVASERIATILLSALVAHTGWHWMTDRFGVLRQYQFQWPGLSVALLVSVVSWLAAIGILAVLGRLALRGLRQLMERDTAGKIAAGAAE